jgi:hypothetical protein
MRKLASVEGIGGQEEGEAMITSRAEGRERAKAVVLGR